MVLFRTAISGQRFSVVISMLALDVAATSGEGLDREGVLLELEAALSETGGKEPAMSRYRISPPARQDLIDILDFIA
jgi:hypothetical protein